MASRVINITGLDKIAQVAAVAGKRRNRSIDSAHEHPLSA